MLSRIRSRYLGTVLATAGVAGLLSTVTSMQTASASGYQPLYSFQGPTTDGALPNGRLTPGPHGALFGTTTYGGSGSCSVTGQPAGCGTVFELSPAQGGGWTETVLYNFQGGSDGEAPQGHLIYLHGALYGTTETGGIGTCDVIDTGCGTVFQLKKKGTTWTESVLYSFTGGTDGANPFAGVLASDGVLYGTAVFGGNDVQHCNKGAEGSGCGVVFALTLSGSESVIHTFTGSPDGANPNSDLMMDSTGTLYGQTLYGGNNGCAVGCGTVFTLTPSGSSWTENVIYAFQGGTDGAYPETGPLVMDKGGNLYGTTELGGGSGCNGSGCGTVFEMSRSGSAWTETPIYSFTGGSDSWYPEAGVTLGKRGALYGTDQGYYNVGTDGNRNGTVFELVPGKSGGSWTYSLVHGFGGGTSDGCYPFAGLVSVKGVLYGASEGCGADGEGMIFSLTP